MRRFLLVTAVMGLLAFGTAGLVQAKDGHHRSRSHGYSGHSSQGGYARSYRNGYGHDNHSGHGGYRPAYGGHGHGGPGYGGRGVQISPHIDLRIGH